MTRAGISRRRVLGGLATVGGLGAVSGAGSNAALRDREGVRNELVAGALDLEVCADDDGDCEPGPGNQVSIPIDLDGAEEGDATVRVELPDDGRNNPGYVWFRTNCPMGRCGIEQALRVTIREDRNCNGETGRFDPVLARGSLCEVQNRFGSGELLQRDPVQPGERICFEIFWRLEDELCEDDAATLELEFFAHQARHSDGPQRPWSNRCKGICKTSDDCACDEGPAISFVAFCVPDGTVLGPDDVRFTWRNDGEGEPVEIQWESSVGLSTVVLYYGTQAGPVFENFDDGTSGMATVGHGEPERPGQTPPSPAPEGETGLKYEYDAENGVFVLEAEEEPLVLADPSSTGTNSTHRVEIPVPESLVGLPLSEFAIEYAGDVDLASATPTRTTAGNETATVTAVTADDTELAVTFDETTSLVGGTVLGIEYAPVSNPTVPGDYRVEATVTAGGRSITITGPVRIE